MVMGRHKNRISQSKKWHERSRNKDKPEDQEKEKVKETIPEKNPSRTDISPDDFPGDLKKSTSGDKEENQPAEKSEEDSFFNKHINAPEFQPKRTPSDKFHSHRSTNNSQCSASEDATQNIEVGEYYLRHRQSIKDSRVGTVSESSIHPKGAVYVGDIEPKVKVVIPRTAHTDRIQVKQEKYKAPRKSVSTIEIPVSTKCHNCLEEQIITAEIPNDFKTKSTLRKYELLLDCLIFYVNPLAKNPDSQITLSALLKEAMVTRAELSSEDAAKIEESKLIEFGKELLRYWRYLKAFQFAKKGYYAARYFDEFPVDSELDGFSDFKTHDEFITEVLASDLHIKNFEGNVEKERKDANLIEGLIEVRGEEDLKKMDVHYDATPQVRLQHDMDVTDEEIFKMVDESVRTDYGCFLWLASNKPHRLLNSAAIADSVIGAIHQKLLSKDQRPRAALYTIMPQMLASLSVKELDSLSEKYISNDKIKVANWCEELFLGYTMRCLQLKPKVVPHPSKCIIIAKLEEIEKPEQLTPFLIFCALIADLSGDRFTPVFDNSTDPFCHRILRCLIRNDISPEKKKILVDAILLLPKPITSRMFAEEEYKLSTSIYRSFDFFKNGVFINKIAPSEYVYAIQALNEHISPTRLIKHYILPELDKPSAFWAASIWEEILQLEKHRQEVASGTHLSVADVINSALKLYIEPDSEGKNSRRFGFIEKLLRFADSVLNGEVNSEVIKSVNDVISNRQLHWYQLYVILSVCFPKAGKKLDQPKLPFIDTQVGDNLKEAKLPGIIYSWPDITKSGEAFDNYLSSDKICGLDDAKITFILTSTLLEDSSKLSEECKDFIKNYLKKMSEIPKFKYKSIKTESVSSSKKWMENLLESKDLDSSVREAVINAAQEYRMYWDITGYRSSKRRTPVNSKKDTNHRAPSDNEHYKAPQNRNRGHNDGNGPSRRGRRPRSGAGLHQSVSNC